LGFYILAHLLPRAKCGLPYIDASVTDPQYTKAQEEVKTALQTQIRNLVGAELRLAGNYVDLQLAGTLKRWLRRCCL
jgi:hypothetical protein